MQCMTSMNETKLSTEGNTSNFYLPPISTGKKPEKRRSLSNPGERPNYAESMKQKGSDQQDKVLSSSVTRCLRACDHTSGHQRHTIRYLPSTSVKETSATTDGSKTNILQKYRPNTIANSELSALNGQQKHKLLRRRSITITSEFEPGDEDREYMISRPNTMAIEVRHKPAVGNRPGTPHPLKNISGIRRTESSLATATADIHHVVDLSGRNTSLSLHAKASSLMRSMTFPSIGENSQNDSDNSHTNTMRIASGQLKLSYLGFSSRNQFSDNHEIES